MTWLLLSIAYLALAFVCNSLLVRLPIKGNFVFKFLGCGVVFWLALAVHLLVLDGATPASLAGLLLFAFCWELNIFLFATISRSVSVGLLLHLRAGSLTSDEIQR